MHPNSAKLQFTTQCEGLTSWNLSPEQREHASQLVLKATDFGMWPDCFVPELALLDEALDACEVADDTMLTTIASLQQARRNLYEYFAAQDYGNRAFNLEMGMLEVLAKAVNPDRKKMLEAAERISERVCPSNALRPKGTPEQKVRLTRMQLWAYDLATQHPVAGIDYTDDELYSILTASLRDISLPTNSEPEV